MRIDWIIWYAGTSRATISPIFQGRKCSKGKIVCAGEIVYHAYRSGLGL